MIKNNIEIFFFKKKSVFKKFFINLIIIKISHGGFIGSWNLNKFLKFKLFLPLSYEIIDNFILSVLLDLFENNDYI
jgi:hypothetical protein